MDIKGIYEKVNLMTPLEQRRFFNYFDDCVNEMRNMFAGYDKDYVIEEGEEYSPLQSLEDDNHVRERYYGALVDGILFYAGTGEEYKSEFIRKARDAFLKYWTDNAKGRRIKRMRW